MRKILFLSVILLTVFAFETQARIRIPVGEYQKIEQVAELPDSAYYETKDGKHINLGYMYTVYEVAFVPLWTTDEGKIVGYEKESDTYYDLDEEMISTIKEDIKVENLDSLKSMPFWDAWGGKLIVIGIIVIIIVTQLPGKKKEEDADEVPAAKEEE